MQYMMPLTSTESIVQEPEKDIRACQLPKGSW